MFSLMNFAAEIAAEAEGFSGNYPGKTRYRCQSERCRNAAPRKNHGICLWRR